MMTYSTLADLLPCQFAKEEWEYLSWHNLCMTIYLCYEKCVGLNLNVTDLPDPVLKFVIEKV